MKITVIIIIKTETREISHKTNKRQINKTQNYQKKRKKSPKSRKKNKQTQSYRKTIQRRKQPQQDANNQKGHKMITEMQNEHKTGEDVKGGVGGDEAADWTTD